MGERRGDFLRGWREEIAEQEAERKTLLVREYDVMAQGHEKGDPATWWK